MATLAEVLKGYQEGKAEQRKKAKPPVYEYRPCIVTFLDILGFKAMIAKMTAQQIGDALALLGQISDGDVKETDDWPAGLARSIAFSDSIVRMCPIDGDDPSGSFFHELIALVHIQGELAHRGIFMRGGMSVGDIYFSGTILFGPGLVRAFEMESQFASYPRIVIDPNVIEAYVTNPVMRGSLHTLEEDSEYTGDLMRVSDDGLHFVDYLRAYEREMDEPKKYPELLRLHRDMIVKASADAKGFSNIKQKYSWLAHYHNSVAQNAYKKARKMDLLVDLTTLLYPSLRAEMDAAAKA
jgi:hypothetical protein